MDHPNSHVVYVRRKPLFDTENRPELEEYFAGSNVGVGSYFGKGTSREASGLNILEENFLMPLIISIPETDRDFRTKVNEYFSNIDSKVPANSFPDVLPTDGLKLEIGLLKDNDLPVGPDNPPINVEDFVRFRQISNHPWVATEEEAIGNQLKRFYIHDPEARQQVTIDSNNAKDEALTHYLLIKKDPRQVRMYLTLMGINTTLLKSGEDLTTLRKMAEGDPVKFMAVFSDKDKQLRYTIEDMIQNKILEKVGDRILTMDGTVLGRDMKETILYLRDTHNTKVYTRLKALLQESWKKNSVSVETIEDLDAPVQETDADLERRLGAQRDKLTTAIDKMPPQGMAKTKTAAQIKAAEPSAPTGLDISTEPEAEVETLPEGLGNIDAGTETEGMDDVPQEELVDDGRAKNLTPEDLKS